MAESRGSMHPKTLTLAEVGPWERLAALDYPACLLAARLGLRTASWVFMGSSLGHL